jgi:S1-C subfamily serine protease
MKRRDDAGDRRRRAATQAGLGGDAAGGGARARLAGAWLAALIAAASPASSPRGAAPAAADAVPAPVARAYASVVSVRVRETIRVPVFRNGRFEREAVEGRGAGSGVAVDADLVLTNAHVVAGALEVRVGRPGRRDSMARVVAVDQASDLALLRVAGGGLRPLPFATSPPVPGQAVFVLGNRADRGPEVAWATIGGHPRVRAGARPIEFWCELEAPIGPGNSGGAVLDADGRLLGVPGLVVSYTEAARRGARAAGLFIPARHAARAVARMRDGSAPSWPWLGLLLDDPLLAQSGGRPFDASLPPTVRHVLPGSPAAAAGLRRGDRIVAVGDRPASDHFEALDAVLDLVPGQKVTLRIERRGVPAAVEVEAAERPADPRPEPLEDFMLHTGIRVRVPAAGGEGRADRRGLEFAGMSAQARRSMPAFEAEMFRSAPALEGIVTGRSLLAGRPRRITVSSVADLAAAVPGCFVEEQFVAVVHWTAETGESVDRAYVHRKIYPVVL